jgi:hypothetical protein
VGGTPPNCNDGNSCTNDACDPASGCVHTSNNTCGANPHGRGYWKRLCRGPHPSGDFYTMVDVDCLNNTCTFGSITSTADICDRLQPNPNNDKCEQAEAQFMTLMLNVCRGRISAVDTIDSTCGGAPGTVGQSLAQADALLCSPARDRASCASAQCLSEELSSGKAMHVTSLVVSRLSSSSLKLSWTPPYVESGNVSGLKYRVWRRPISESAFTLLTETTRLEFIDTMAGTGNFQYEVSVVW